MALALIQHIHHIQHVFSDHVRCVSYMCTPCSFRLETHEFLESLRLSAKKEAARLDAITFEEEERQRIIAIESGVDVPGGEPGEA